MKIMMKAALLAAVAFALPTTASAQVTTAGIAVANLEEAVQKSAAFGVAIGQIKVTYKAQIDALEARQKTLNAELQPIVNAFQAAQKAPNPNQAALQTQYNAIQTKQQNGQRELQNLGQPVARAQAWVEEQIVSKLDAALKAAMIKKSVALVLQPQATVSYQPVADLTDEVTAELNLTVPSVTITPAASWQPGGQGGAGAANPGAPKPPVAPAPKPQGR
jgi:Skp family chaperone for outer membrane proteins